MVRSRNSTAVQTEPGALEAENGELQVRATVARPMRMRAIAIWRARA